VQIDVKQHGIKASDTIELSTIWEEQCSKESGCLLYM
jgi:hypothetical protein